MQPRTAFPVACLALGTLASILATARPASAAWPHDPRVNVPICVHSEYKRSLVACSDGTGGMILAWRDERSGVGRIYAQRVLADGTIAPGWPGNGVQLTTTYSTRDQAEPEICSDGAGGAIVAWHETYSEVDVDIYAQQVTAGGSRSWGSTGVGVCTSGDYQYYPVVAPDGAGGVFIAWQDRRFGSYDIYAQHLTSAGSIAPGSWVSGGNAFCSASGVQYWPAVVADGYGGFDVAWFDQRGPYTYAIYAQRVTSTGGLASGWTVDGVLVTAGNYTLDELKVAPNSMGGGLYVWVDYRAGVSDPNIYATSINGTGMVVGYIGGGGICTAAGYQVGLSVTPDGAGGAFACWYDGRSGSYSDIYAERITGSGYIAAGWPDASTGLAVCTAAYGQYTPVAVSDGVGGAIIAWPDERTRIRTDIYATHITASGYLAEGWSYDNNPICTADLEQGSPMIATDGASGAVVAWLDGRNGSLSYSDIYAQRVERFGKLGDPEPAIVSVRDIPNDQGGSVRVSWNASYMDAYPDFGVTAYWLWRQVPARAALAALAAGARLADPEEDPGAIPGRVFRAGGLASQAWYWEFVTSQTANGFPSYSLVAPTAGDSVSGSNPYTVFLIEARSYGYGYWDSRPDSGYSVDNLPPAVPAPFAGTYLAGQTALQWGANGEPDLANYRLYRGTSAGFVPGPGNLVVQKSSPGYLDNAGQPYFYKLSAVDIHGNESAFSFVQPSGTVDAPADLPREIALAGAAPNPVREATTIRWALPRAARVRLAVFDASGRLVRELADGAFPAGRHAAAWDARDGAGRAVASGIYFLQLEAEGRTLRSRMAAIR
ncbi:MAG: hypothetical protein HZC42_06275 [Candidatus Eisenbacteria bacterium]|nr:hypothetical protein [Candidatus Eisenbacteria bacterium]